MGGYVSSPKLVTPEPAKQAIVSSDKPRFKALVIDDSLAMRVQLETALNGNGINTDLVDNGEQAIELATAEHYDLIFLDVMMPGIDGYETCERMRAIDTLKRTPIIMLTGKTSPLDEVKGVIAGCTTYMTKPVVPEKLQSVLNRTVQWIEQYK